MGPKLVDYLLYEPEDSGILWIKFNRPERMNAHSNLVTCSSPLSTLLSSSPALFGTTEH